MARRPPGADDAEPARRGSLSVHHVETCSFDPIPAGTYAVACFHDENKNGKCDTGLFGIPTEGTEPNAPDARIVIEGRDVLLKE